MLHIITSWMHIQQAFDEKFRRVSPCGSDLLAISMFHGGGCRPFPLTSRMPQFSLLVDEKWHRMHGKHIERCLMVVAID